MSNRLQNEISPYLLHHAEDPVDWFPWGDEAFEKAKSEDKPIFLSIGYSTCHWCHVMARESFREREIAALLNEHFISIKVDKEERPDIDSIYMTICQAMTGRGGWPMSIFMNWEQKPFFAGTYFPKTSRGGVIGFKELLLIICEKWEHDRKALMTSANSVLQAMEEPAVTHARPDEKLIQQALAAYVKSFDREFGGFGAAPKFPTPHHLLFLMQQYEKEGKAEYLDMAEKTLLQLYRGGIFDHIGGGFCRYSTDAYFLVPHFEKMLYDNALLIMAYCKAYEITANELYRYVAERTASYLFAEMSHENGGFYSAQDADSDGVEGKYYVFTPEEIREIFGDEEGDAFCRHYGITENGNFEGGSIPNLLHQNDTERDFDSFFPRLIQYRKNRAPLDTDDKILTFWNGLMISALSSLYSVSGDNVYLREAEKTQSFIDKNLCEGDTLYVGERRGRRSGKGYLPDYAGYIYGLLSLYKVTLRRSYLQRAKELTAKAVAEFFDEENGGFYLYGKGSEKLITRPKESYDAAVPSGNSLMACNLMLLNYLSPEEDLGVLLQKQLRFMAGEAKPYPAGYAMFLTALSDWLEPPAVVTVVQGKGRITPPQLPLDTVVRVLDAPGDGYGLLDGETTFYVCKNHTCLAPMKGDAFYENQNKSRERI